VDGEMIERPRKLVRSDTAAILAARCACSCKLDIVHRDRTAWLGM
jgi:hypothetical protein